MARRTESLGDRAHRSAIGPIRWLGDRSRFPAPATRKDQSGGIRDDRIEELDLHADYRSQAGLLRRRGEADSAVQALVIGNRKRLQIQPDRPLNQVLNT